MTAELIDTGLKLANFALSIAAIAFAYVRTRRKDVDGRLHEGSKRMDSQEARIARLEQTVHDMPGRDETHRLELRLTEMAGSMNAMSASMSGQNEILARLERVVTRHEDHLLEGGRNR